MKTKAVMGSLRSSTGDVVSADAAKAEILNTFFSGVFTQERRAELPGIAVGTAVPELCDVDITPERIEQKLIALHPGSAPGPDEIHPRVLREARKALSSPLSLLYRKSLDAGRVPRDWTLGRMALAPIFKKGDRRDPGNYRAVSLTAVPCKVLESLIRDELMQHLLESRLLSHCQQWIPSEALMYDAADRGPRRME